MLGVERAQFRQQARMIGGVVDRHIDAILDARALRRKGKLAALEGQRTGIMPKRNGRRGVLELRQRWSGMKGERQNKERGKYGLQNHAEVNDGDGRSVRADDSILDE